MKIAPFSWFIGAVLGALVYYFVTKARRDPAVEAREPVTVNNDLPENVK